MAMSPSRTSISSAELADEATAMDGTSPTGSLTRSSSSAFKSFQRTSPEQSEGSSPRSQSSRDGESTDTQPKSHASP